MDDPLDARWSQCKDSLRTHLSSEDAASWLPPLELTALTTGRAVFNGVPNTFFKNRIRRHFAGLLRDCLSAAFPELPQQDQFLLELNVGDLPPKKGAPGRKEPSGAAGHSLPARETPARPSAPQSAGASMGSAEPGSAAPGSPVSRTTVAGRYQFDNFVEGPANEAAARFAREVAANPGGRFNPLFLAGGMGNGKTHLLHAIGAEINAAQPEWSVLCLTAEAFANEVLDGIRFKKMKGVRERFRGADALALDDLEFLGVSAKAQEELLHTFDALHAGGKQLVFAGDRFPSAMTRLNPTLRSRLEMGLIAELDPPDETLRLGIVNARARAEGMDLPEESAKLLAARITSGARQLVGALVRLSAYGSMHDQPLTPEFVARWAEPFFDKPDEKPRSALPAEEVIGAVCDHSGVTMKVLRSRNRSQSVTKARRVAAFLLRETSGLSLPEIGATLGNRTHSTVLHSLKRMAGEMEKDPAFAREIERLKARLLAGNHGEGE